MAAAPKQNLGKIPCPCCRQPVALKKSATGKLSFQCQEADCEATGFADQHTAAARKWIAALGECQQTASEPPKPTPAQPPKAPASSAPPAPDPQPPKKGGFSFPGL